MNDDKKPEDEVAPDASNPEHETNSMAEFEVTDAAAAEESPETSDRPEKETPSATGSAEAESTAAAKSSGAVFIRVALVILFSILLYIEVKYGILLGVLVTLVTHLAIGEPPEQVRKFLKALSKVVFSTVAFVLMQTEERPWPLAPWPKSDDD